MAIERAKSPKEIVALLSQASEAIEAYQRNIQAVSPEPIERLGAVIKEERKRQKISRDLLAKLSGVSIGTVIAVESGKSSASLSNVQKILQALGRKLWIK